MNISVTSINYWICWKLSVLFSSALKLFPDTQHISSSLLTAAFNRVRNLPHRFMRFPQFVESKTFLRHFGVVMIILAQILSWCLSKENDSTNINLSSWCKYQSPADSMRISVDRKQQEAAHHPTFTSRDASSTYTSPQETRDRRFFWFCSVVKTQEEKIWGFKPKLCLCGGGTGSLQEGEGDAEKHHKQNRTAQRKHLFLLKQMNWEVQTASGSAAQRNDFHICNSNLHHHAVTAKSWSVCSHTEIRKLLCEL